MAFSVVIHVRTIIKYSILGGSSYQLNTQISFSSVDYTVDEENVPGLEPAQPVVDAAPSAWSAPATDSAAWPAASEAAPWSAPEANAPDTQQWSADFQNQSGPHSTTSIEQEFGERFLKSYVTSLRRGRRVQHF